MQAAVEGAGIRQVDATWLQVKQERK